MNNLFLYFLVISIGSSCILQVLDIDFSKTLYVIEFIYIILCIFYILLHKSQCLSVIKFLLVAVFLLLLSFLLSPYYEFLSSLKIVSYIIVFYSGYLANKKQNSDTYKKQHKRGIYFIVFFPLLFSVFQHFIGSDNKYPIFVNSNNYVYFGLAVSITFYFYFQSLKWTFVVALSYLITGSTIGALLAFSVSLFVYFYKQIVWKYALVLLSLFIIIILCVWYIDIPIFFRIKDTINIAYNLFLNYSLEDIVDINYSIAAQYGEDSNNTSFLFRLKHWTEIVNLFFKSNFSEVFFGHGESSLYYLTSSHHVAHNDYLMILFDYGLIFFVLILYFLIIFLERIKKNPVSIFFLSVFIYSASENLYYNMLANIVIYYLAGAYFYLCKNCNYESITNK